MDDRVREMMKTRSLATLIVVQKMASGGTGAAGEAATPLVEEEQDTEVGPVLRPDMEAARVLDLVMRAGTATTSPVKSLAP